MEHRLKTVNPYFNKVWEGEKTFEVRKNDRDFKEGDTVILEEYDAEKDEYLRREVHGKITYILVDYPAIQNGYVVFSFMMTDKIKY